MADQHPDKGVGRGVADRGSDEHVGTTNVSVGSLESTRVADQHSDKDVSIADSALKSSKSKGVADKHSDEGASATTSNVPVENSGSTVEINIKTLDSQLHSFHVNKSMPVSLFKEKIAEEIGLPVDQQRLIFRGKVLKDEDLLSEYHVESGHTLHLVSRQPSEFQPSFGSHDSETNANISNAGMRPRIGHVSHSVVLGTFGGGDQNEGGTPDISQVIGAVLDSFGIGGQTPMGGIGTSQPNMQFSIPVQVGQGNETGSTTNPSQSVPEGLQIPLGSVALLPTLTTPIPDSLNTLSEFMTQMENALSEDGFQPANSTPIELPTNARGFRSPAALVVVLQQAQRLLSGSAVDSLSRTSRRLEEVEGCTDVTVRTQIQEEAMQSGLAMQHLGALFLELGRTMLTLRVGQTHADSSVTAGPSVYISPSGPNPIMVQPFPLQNNSLFDGQTNPTMNHGAFGPMGVGAIPRNLNIHIHAGVGASATNVEANQSEHANRMSSGNQGFGGQADNAPSNIRMRSLSETESCSSSSRSTSTPGNSSAIPAGLGSGGLQPKRRNKQQTRSEAGSSGTSNQTLTSDPATTMNQIMQDPALGGLLAQLSNQSGGGSQDFLKNIMSQVAQNPAMMNTINQLSQQMDCNQDGGGGNLDISNMVQQMMPYLSQALNRGSSSSNLLQKVPSKKGSLPRRYGSSVKSLNSSDRSSEFQMNLEHMAQKIVDQYPPLEIFSSLVETASGLYNNACDTVALDELCLEEELAQEFMEMLKRDVTRRLQGDRR